VREALDFLRITSSIQINGREIFQKERVDKGAIRRPGNGTLRGFGKPNTHGWNRESSYSGCSVERVTEMQAQACRTRMISARESVVIWKPNQIFEKSDREGDDSQEKSPFRFLRRSPDDLVKFAGSLSIRIGNSDLGLLRRSPAPPSTAACSWTMVTGL
jgi:hypothetical protein